MHSPSTAVRVNHSSKLLLKPLVFSTYPKAAQLIGITQIPMIPIPILLIGNFPILASISIYGFFEISQQLMDGLP